MIHRRVTLVVFAVLIVLVCCGQSTSEGLEAIVAYGCVFSVHMDELDVHPLACLSPTALYAARDERGRVWAPSGPISVAAIDVHSGRTVTSVVLPDPPHILASAGRHALLISHNTLRSDGFAVSVVDPETGELAATRAGFPGPVTGIVTAGRAVFITTLGLRPDDVNRLYRIPVPELAGRDALPEPVLAERRGNTQWRVSAADGKVWLVSVTGRDTVDPKVRVLDPSAGRVIGSLEAHDLGDITHIIDAPFPRDETGFMPVLLRDGSTAYALLRLSPLSLERIVALPGPISRVIAADDNTVAYVDSLATAGPDGLRVTFASRETGEEVGSVHLAELAQDAFRAQSRQGGK